MTNSGLPNHRKAEEYNDTIYAKRLMMVYIPSSSLGGWVGFADAATALVERLVVSWSCCTSGSRTHSKQEIATIELGETHPFRLKATGRYVRPVVQASLACVKALVHRCGFGSILFCARRVF